MWNCKRCRAEVEDNFVICWNCGTTIAGVEDPNFQKETDSAAARQAKPAQTRSERSCLKCKSNRIVPSVYFPDSNGERMDSRLLAAVDRDPSAWIIKGTETSEVQAMVCGDCGFCEFYVSEPTKLWRAYDYSRR